MVLYAVFSQEECLLVTPFKTQVGVVKVMIPHAVNCSKELWLKFPVLAPSRSEITNQTRYP